MIHIVCDSCESRFEVDPATSGPETPCPRCGYVNGVPGATPAPPATTPPSGEAPGRTGPKPGRPEERLLIVRPVMARARPLLFGALSLATCAGLVGTAILLAQGMPEWAILPGLVLLLSVGGWVWWKLKAMSAALEITTARTISTEGLLSKSTSEVYHDNVRNIQISQSFWNRLWNVGAIGLSSAGQDEIEIEIKDIAAPGSVRDLINKHRA